MRTRIEQYDYVTQTASQPANSWTNKDMALFHAFNPNGLVSQKRKNDELIREMVDAGEVPSGWHFAYGSLRDTYAESMRKLAMQRRVSSIKLCVTTELLQEQIQEVTLKIAETKNENRRPPFDGRERGDRCTNQIKPPFHPPRKSVKDYRA
jgi:hypothetical protein